MAGPEHADEGGAFNWKPLTPATFADLETLFGKPGGSIVRGCWCMHYRQTGPRTEPGGAKAKQDMHDLVEGGVMPGLIGYLDGDPVAWISLGPRPDFLRMRRSSVMKPVDDTPVWSVVCSYIAKPHRGRGLHHRMLAAAIQFATASGAQVLEAYPVDKQERSNDDFMWFGSRSLYEAAGFTEVTRRSPMRIVMRLAL